MRSTVGRWSFVVTTPICQLVSGSMLLYNQLGAPSLQNLPVTRVFNWDGDSCEWIFWNSCRAWRAVNRLLVSLVTIESKKGPIVGTISSICYRGFSMQIIQIWGADYSLEPNAEVYALEIKYQPWRDSMGLGAFRILSVGNWKIWSTGYPLGPCLQDRLTILQSRIWHNVWQINHVNPSNVTHLYLQAHWCLYFVQGNQREQYDVHVKNRIPGGVILMRGIN